MLFGPVFTAEMLTSARRTRHVLTRVAYGSVLLMALVMVYGQEWSPIAPRITTVQQYAAAASVFFVTFSVLQLLGVILIAPALTAGAIAQERQRRTIEYLFATDLANWEIVLGKFMASLAKGVAFLLVGPPILALAMWMGGVSPDRLLAVLLATLSSLLVVIALALAVSVWSARARQAVTRCYFYLAVLLLLPALVYGLGFALLRSYPGWVWLLAPLHSGSQALMGANPLFVVPMVLSGQTTTAGGLWTPIWGLVAGHLMGTVICLATALVAVRRVHLRGVSSASRKPMRVRAQRPIGQSAMLWKELYAQRTSNTLGALGRIVLGLLAVTLAGLTCKAYLDALKAPNSDYFTPFVAVVGTLIECLATLFVGTRAATAITSEKERDTWTTLLSTPLQAKEIVLSKWAASLYAARWMMLPLVVLWLMAITIDATFLLAVPFLVLSLTVVLIFASSLGTWLSLRANSSTRALGSTMGLLLVLGGGYLPVGSCCCGLAFRGSDLLKLQFAPCLPFLLAVPHLLPEAVNSSHSYSADLLSAPVAYLLGIVGYGILSHFLLWRTISNFDQDAGRTFPGGNWPLRGPAKLPPRLVQGDCDAVGKV
jgi:ABC-type transport system involved in multi-copper enzyme maturation permease subunit